MNITPIRRNKPIYTTLFSMKHRRFAEDRECRVCGKVFTPKVNAFNQPEKYCSKECFKKGVINTTNKHNKWKYKSDPTFKFNSGVRQACNHAISGDSHWSEETFMSRMGYSVDELKEQLQTRWNDGMNWDNYGDWNIDHVVPTSFFVFTDYSDLAFKACWSLKNIQPMWRGDNSSKSNILQFSALKKVPLVLSRNLDLLQICYKYEGKLIKLQHGGNVDRRFVDLAKKAFTT